MKNSNARVYSSQIFLIKKTNLDDRVISNLKEIKKHIEYHETKSKQQQDVRRFLYESLLNFAWLWSRARLAENKRDKCFSNHQLPKQSILVFGSYSRTEKVSKLIFTFIYTN